LQRRPSVEGSFGDQTCAMSRHIFQCQAESVPGEYCTVTENRVPQMAKIRLRLDPMTMLLPLNPLHICRHVTQVR
jgi:hypothetical protein